MKKLYIGGHLRTEYGFTSTADYSQKIGANFFQIYLSSPKGYSRKNREDTELAILKSKLDKYEMKMVIHGSLVLNFCNDKKSYISEKGISSLVEDLKDCSKLGALGVVIHMGKKKDMKEDIAIQNYVNALKEVLTKSPKDSKIILETGAGVGSEVCTKITDLHDLYNKFTNEEKKRITFCIDTCHVFAAGYDLGNEKYVDIFDNLIKSTITWNKVSCVHLNDSKCPFGSCKDRHADLTTGYIKKDGLKKFVKMCYNYGIPMVLETPLDSERCEASKLKNKSKFNDCKCDKCNNTRMRKKQIKMVKDWTTSDP